MTKFASSRWITLVLNAAFLIGCASVLRAAERPVELRDVRGMIVYAPRKEFYRAWQADASCTIIMVVDPVSGRVTRDYLESSSGNNYLNNVALEMLREWKFKPGSPSLIRTSFGFGEAGFRHSFQRDRRSQSMNKVLEPFLGKNALVRGGRLPDYPRDTPWTNKHGTAVFDLHVASNGEVKGVTVKKSSGDAPFDEVMVLAMRQWRFRKGPLELELPLYFALTPQRFAIRVPKYP